mmetsp:Transcript_28724/g.40063  ORF Transcript_28724/g.40063 Transcript_28724/m.40063 type:complete len:159 (+) Transcript_28724:52-528(+)|eukprot:CAMPEP_0185263280 /NCGR_PEP_ID=MMETSP1359-20130426/13369_1 /TAXON_ID=552665 /ORGANISM="Bigelowiella longifila, Strain CCMP242" /LENGTH=158 /DNA_ID=CAMNT_0027850651 /DNA_START=32 /DNA_END=508 /DNA_ORIENTATION=+
MRADGIHRSFAVDLIRRAVLICIISLQASASSMLYATRANVTRDGKAIVVDLSDVANLPYDPTCVSMPHNTILYRDSGYSRSELQLVREARDHYFKENQLNKLEFSLATWKKWPDSDLVSGSLKDMWDFIQEEFKEINKNERSCHVQMRCPSTESCPN